MASAPLRIAVPIYEPYTYPCIYNITVVSRSTTCEYPGIAAEIMATAIDASSRFGYELIATDTVDWGTVIGTNATTGIYIFDGLLGQVQNGTFDTVMTEWAMTDVRFNALDYTFPLPTTFSGNGYIAHRPVPNSISSIEDSALMLFRVFDLSIWLLIIAFIFIVSLILSISMRIHSHRRSFPSVLWRTFLMAIRQGTEELPPSINIAITLAITIICLLFIHKFYEAYLVEVLARASNQQPFTGMAQLAQLILDNRFRLITDDDTSYFFTQVQFGNASSFVLMRKAIAYAPPIIETRGLDVIIDRMLADPTLVLPGRARLNAIGLIVNQCDLMFIPDNDIIAWSSFMFRKHSKSGEAVSTAMMSMVEYMIAIGNRYQMHETDGDQCRKLQDQQTARLETHVLTIENYYGAILILIFGAIAASIAFVGELVTFRYLRPRKVLTITAKSIKSRMIKNDRVVANGVVAAQSEKPIKNGFCDNWQFK